MLSIFGRILKSTLPNLSLSFRTAVEMNYQRTINHQKQSVINEWKVLFPLFLCVFFVTCDAIFIGPLIPSIMKNTAAVMEKGGLLITAYNISAGTVLLFLAPFIDRLGRKRLLIGGVLLVGISAFFFASNNSFEGLILIRSISGIGGAFILPISFSVASDHFPYEKRGKVISILTGGVVFANLIGIPLSNRVAYLFSWQWSFFMVSCFAVIPLLLLLLIVPDISSEKKEKRSLAQVKKNLFVPSVFLSLFCMFLWYSTLFGLLPFLGVFFIKTFSVDVGTIGLLYLIPSAGYLSGTFLGGKFADRWGKITSFLVASSMITVTLLLFTKLFLHFDLTLILLFFWGIFFGVGETALISFISELDSKNRSVILSLNGVFSLYAKAAITFIGSFILAGKGISGNLLLCAVSSCFAFGIILFALRNLKDKSLITREKLINRFFIN